MGMCIPVFTCVYLWVSMGIYGYLWVSMFFRGNIGISTYIKSVAPLSFPIINLGKPEGLPDDYYYNSVGAPRVSHEQGIGEA